jgi:hypothetical protein
MKFTFAMYDALIQAGIKPEAARRVVTAMETDMTTLLATKQDVALLRKDIEKESLSLKIWLGGRVSADLCVKPYHRRRDGDGYGKGTGHGSEDSGAYAGRAAEGRQQT